VVRLVRGENEPGIVGVVVPGLGHRGRPSSEDRGVPRHVVPGLATSMAPPPLRFARPGTLWETGFRRPYRTRSPIRRGRSQVEPRGVRNTFTIFARDLRDRDFLRAPSSSSGSHRSGCVSAWRRCEPSLRMGAASPPD
jgi:hypothetical protein